MPGTHKCQFKFAKFELEDRKMKDFRKSDYALNKNKKGIVYKYGDGSILEITFEKIAEGNPEFTYEDFEKLKAFSDQIYLEQIREENRNAYYVKASIDEFDNPVWLATNSLEEELLGPDIETISVDQVKKIAEKYLTKIQKRRFFMYLEGLSTVKIAEIEGCNQNAVWESITLARKKIQKFL